MKQVKVRQSMFVLAIALAILVPATVLAQSKPDVDNECINDHAEVVSKGDLGKIEKLCKKAKENQVPMMVVVVKSLEDFRPRPLSVDRFADRIFNDWDTGYEEGKDAVFLFVSLKENEFRVIMGDNYSEKLRGKASRIIANALVPAFRRRAHSSGIRQAYDSLYFNVVKPHVVSQRKELQRKQQENIRKEMQSTE